MDYINGNLEKNYVEYSEFAEHVNQVVNIHGYIHRIREMSDFKFVIIRTKREEIQCIYSKEVSSFEWTEEYCEQQCVEISGLVVADTTRPGRFELQIHTMKVLSKPFEQLPIVINKKQLDVPLDTNLSLRPVSLRNPKERAIFKLQEGLQKGFREYLMKNRFTEIKTPKINFASAEGGANVFKLDYFGKEVFLAQSPQFYKQMMVGVFERVFEIDPVYRAEHHDTSRHLNEYISMDFEMGFINSFYDIMEMETGMLKYTIELLKEEYALELDILKAKLPTIDKIPTIKFMDAKELLMKKYKMKITDFDDFAPEEEATLCKYAEKELGSEFIFVTHYPSSKRPFYAMDDAEDPNYTLSFDLLFRGLEITTGGQRIHDYEKQVEKMVARGMNPEHFESYLTAHKYGLPPHGGLGLGLERLLTKLLGYPNVRSGSLFPRDINRVTP
ncbi:MAG: aspartate--tRNA(Asn) ligase [Clostridia bacterium]|nr:aspartate--tRNA(Asn) ligase [Clostridia bacterium]